MLCLSGLSFVTAGCTAPDDDVEGTSLATGHLVASPAAAPNASGHSEPEGVRAPSLLVSWEKTARGVMPTATGSITATLFNHTSTAVSGALKLVASGLDGQLLETALGPFNVPANGELGIPVAVDAIPVQSEVSASFVAVQAEFTRPDGAMVRPSTDPLYYHFENGYQRAVFYSSSELLFARGGGSSLQKGNPAVIGRIRRANGWNNVQSAESATSAAAPAGAQTTPSIRANSGPTTAEVIPMAEIESASRQESSQPTAAAAATTYQTTICTNWRVQYVDGGFGEDALATSAWQDAPARFAFYEIRSSGGTLMHQGFLSWLGCVTQPMPAGTSFRFRQFTTNTRSWPAGTPTANIINTYQINDFGTPFAMALETTFSLSGPRTFTFRPTQAHSSVNVAAVAAQMLLANEVGGIGMRGFTLNVRTPQGCGTVDPPTDSCYNPGSDITFIGTTRIGNTNAAHDRWKSVVAHELGHHIQRKAWGSIFYDYNDDTTTEPYCRCDHYDTSWSNRAHCMNSREQVGAAAIEGYAHATATRAFNTDNSTGNAIFAYYKPWRGFDSDASDPEITYPPVPFTLAATAQLRWMANRCPTGATNKGIEYDWLRFYYAISVASIANPTTFNDLASIYRRACTGSPTGECVFGSHSPTWSSLTAAALAHYGGSATNAKFVRFRDSGAAFGVNF
jgi:hypothetical protein